MFGHESPSVHDIRQKSDRYGDPEGQYTTFTSVRHVVMFRFNRVNVI